MLPYRKAVSHQSLAIQIPEVIVIPIVAFLIFLMIYGEQIERSGLAWPHLRSLISFTSTPYLLALYLLALSER
jgi:hypothetical protein